MLWLGLLPLVETHSKTACPSTLAWQWLMFFTVVTVFTELHWMLKAEPLITPVSLCTLTMTLRLAPSMVTTIVTRRKTLLSLESCHVATATLCLSSCLTHLLLMPSLPRPKKNLPLNASVMKHGSITNVFAKSDGKELQCVWCVGAAWDCSQVPGHLSCLQRCSKWLWVHQSLVWGIYSSGVLL